ncbi:threonylcarbamoyl-AMP synthase [Coraliomargarita sinensis]|uniref:Threonylcarbamoyl-AMP synthase n=1 Tax=Coraliomargarita sinensis TaxID=2174842 RepID=A0A317ZJG5_9BACT|nr:L-threonylcarbamoyladenylate synthase [Coraliomargarita sinensis]PXA05690.1 threonylcarbamoyl-AMP synthase [Coraliomargarita sinensis]
MPPREPILKDEPGTLEACADLLRKDQLVAVPTETVYGLAGNALSEKAVRRIFNVKGRPLIDPLITHFKSAAAAFTHVHATEFAETLAEEFWPGPLTLVLEKMPTIPDLVTAGLTSAAVRVPNQPLMQALLQQLDFPLAAPSANPFGYVSPTRPEHVAHTLGPKIGAILDGGICRHGIESTVLDLRNSDNIRILRPGPICAQEIEGLLGRKVQQAKVSKSGKEAQTSPGQLTKHYSPNTKIEIVENGQLKFPLDSGAAVVANKRPLGIERDDLYWLSEDGDLAEVAQNFFDTIQKLDRMGYEALIIEAAPEEGLGVALNDRLRRAATR